jgi:hypothetical protein
MVTNCCSVLAEMFSAVVAWEPVNGVTPETLGAKKVLPG